MNLHVEIPDPPDLTNRPLPIGIEADVLDSTADLRREELEEMLRDGAWTEAVTEWVAYTDLSEREFRLIRDADLFERMDVFWDPTENQIRFEAPSPPPELETQPRLGAKISTEMSDLGQIVLKTLEDSYIDWGETDEGEATWSEDKVSDQTPLKDR